ncbi:MAG TPA: DUF302 domain-containing protein [Candidatus Cloacimonetes bacterium]|nr:DUF302 domain-containing protein [Candidatus Cloacimonadota bacterium]
MKKLTIGLVIGIIVGLVGMGILVWKMMPQKMLNVVKSQYNFEETVALLQEASYSNGWEVLHVYDIGDCLFNEGYDDQMLKVNVISICQSEYSYNILQDDENKKIAAIMPCRIGIYEDLEGDVYITRMNIGLLSKMFGGTIEEIMSYVAKDDEKIIEDIIVQ